MDRVVTDTWSVRSRREARKYDEVNAAVTSEAKHLHRIPDVSSWKLSPDAAYVHLCTNETIVGVEYQETPDVGRSHGRVVVSDVSGRIPSRPADWNGYQVLYGGAQKNTGPAGLTITIVHKDLPGHAHPLYSSAFNWRLVAENGPVYNTPPAYATYIVGLMFQWAKRQGGVEALGTRNIIKSKMLYGFIDASNFYRNEIRPAYWLRINAPLFLNDESRSETFLAQARKWGLVQFKGHRSVGSMRASIYNAVPLEGVEALVDLMRGFERVPM